MKTSIRKILAASAMALICVTTALVAAPAQADTSAVGPLSTEEQFVARQYQDFLGRAPDAAGLRFWSGLLENGRSGSEVVVALSTSAEFQGRVAPVVRLYYAYFLRSPDYSGLRFWANKLATGSTRIAVSQAFADAPEFASTYGSLSNEDFINLVYQNVLGRPADASGRAYWLGLMADGANRGEVMLAFSESAEYRTRMDPVVKATMLYVGLLRRTPDSSGLTYWTSVLRGGGSYTAVIGGFLTGHEYRSRMESIYPQKQPLTGERVTTATTSRAIAVKVDNKDSARPQKNLHLADIVIEEEVEYTITRFIAIYHSEIPPIVGPTRSVRTTDFGVLGAYNTPLLVTSGGNSTVLQILSEFDGTVVLNRNEKTVPAAYFRNFSRQAPHNLYARTATILGSAPAGLAPQPIFQYREPGVRTSVGSATNGVRIDFGANDVSYTWDPFAKGWQRTQNGRVHSMDDGTIIAPDNVVVQETKYVPSIADGNTPEAISAGSGRVHVYTDGKYIRGTWSRPTVADPTTLKDDNGNPILLTPGDTWVALARPEFVTQR